MTRRRGKGLDFSHPRRQHPTASIMIPTKLVVLPDDLIFKILSLLPVISLVRFTCVSKSWKTLIFDPTFVKLHLNRSSSTRNPPCTLITRNSYYKIHTIAYTAKGSPSVTSYEKHVLAVVPCSMQRLIENPSFTLFINRCYLFKDEECNECTRMLGTCNGLILHLTTAVFTHPPYLEYWFRLSNPATRTTSPKFGHFPSFPLQICFSFKFRFGYDNSTGTYKVVAYCCNPLEKRSIVRILTVGNFWRDIESFPAVPLHIDYDHDRYCHNGVYFSDTLNWLAIHNHNGIDYDFKNLRVEQFVIVSLELGTETYNQYLLPLGFDEVPPTQPTHYYPMIPILLFEEDHTMILKSIQEHHPLLYNWRDNKVELIQTTASSTFTGDSIDRGGISWYPPNCYVESLVSPI
ncbi:F-box protein interaction domain protein [Medicago truncatula]|uniref:F-box protein interaction domain protein n=1 Tax=Medicago truncatula TaxID=3880 RepID=G7L6N2_MEDTR|nr:F-box protein interaction domain protein [Medicago truncatula]